jgi:hypothetical protein
MRRILVLLSVLAMPLPAWFGGGHMTVAYIAYKNLTPETRARVDELLKLNPMYSRWVDGVSEDQKGLVAFLNGATWPDAIKSGSYPFADHFTGDHGDNPPGLATDAQNIGYDDTNMHKYWHFVDLPYASGHSGTQPKKPNALTEIDLLRQAISSDEDDAVKSFDVVWLEHLIGDVHQPLHCTSRFTVNTPKGDAGGNLVPFCEKPCGDELHAYWDGLMGDDLTVAQVSDQGDQLMSSGKPADAADLTTNDWVQASFAMAKKDAYASPISRENDRRNPISPRPDDHYAAQAQADAKSQVTLAGYRLADVLNQNLK